ncbi:ABC transporter permease [Mycoplasmatota bacterium WC44]
MIFIDGLIEAFKLLVSFDYEVYSIILLSLFVSIVATLLATIFSIPIAILISINNFKYKRFAKRIIFSLMAIPPVVLGLFVMLLISRKGPLGDLGLLFTPTAMILAQTLLVMPIITGNIITSTEELSLKLIETCKTLGGSSKDIIKLIISETKTFIYMAVMLGFSRAISEVGAVMLVGGSIKGKTRVMTTFIALTNSMGDYTKSLAMGMILLLIAFIVTSLIMRIRGDE